MEESFWIFVILKDYNNARKFLLENYEENINMATTLILLYLNKGDDLLNANLLGIELNKTKAWNLYKNRNVSTGKEFLDEMFINFDRHDRTRTTIYYLIGIRKYYKGFMQLPLDIIKIIAKFLWSTREEYCWRPKRSNNKKLKIN